ncbi:MAG: AIR synthase related protein, partial [Candidatus ainarchaeum sp.]|nr:AIR synthase related protein [Candidatus ainarchaeum sp.]
MAKRIEVKLRNEIKDPRAEGLAAMLKKEFNAQITSLAVMDAYSLDADFDEKELEFLGAEVFSDKVIQEYSYKTPFHAGRWRVEIGYRPGVTDNVGKTAQDAVFDALGKHVAVYSSTVYAMGGELEMENCEAFGKRLANELVQQIIVREPGTDAFEPYVPKVVLKQEINVEEIRLPKDDAQLAQLSKKRLLALSVPEMKSIREHFAKKSVAAERKKTGLGDDPTDVELEVIAQTWSEHCKHKIFNAEISYSENGDSYNIDSLFKTFIRGATEEIKKPYVVSAFKDNGGIIKFDPKNDIAIKVETHNAPSALDPYGGALTGILGVNRDIIGCGMGAYPIANIDVLCFGPLDDKGVDGVLPPRRIYEGVVEGIKDGGNKSGIPTVNGSFVFETCFSARPVIYCGTAGLLPTEIGGRKTAEKKVEP